MARLSASAARIIAGSPGYAAVDRRHALDAHDRAYVRERRAAGWGWQALALQLRMNETTLRREMGDLPPAEPAPPVCNPRAKPVGDYRKIRTGSATAAVLMKIADGVTTRGAIASRLDLALDTVRKVVDDLVERGFLTEAMVLTVQGEIESDRLAELADA